MRITLPRSEWRRIVKKFYEDARFIEELNAITCEAINTDAAEFAVELDNGQALMMGEACGNTMLVEFAEMALRDYEFE